MFGALGQRGLGLGVLPGGGDRVLVGPNFSAIPVARGAAKTFIRNGAIGSVGNDLPAFNTGGLSLHEQRANFLWPDADFTHANWVKSGLTAAMTAIGPDGVVNGASTLTCTGADAVVGQYGANSTAGAHVHSIWMRRRTGSGDVRLNNGAVTGGAAVGANTVQSGDMSSSAGWTLPADVTISGGKLTKVAGAGHRISTVTLLRPLVPGLAYQISFTVDAYSGSSVIYWRMPGGSTQVGTFRSTVGTFTQIVVAQAGATGLELVMNSDVNATIDNLEVRPYCAAPLALTSTWQRFELPAVTTSAIAPNPALGIYMATSGDEVDAAVAEAQAGTFSTPAIRTTSGAATRFYDNASASLAEFGLDATLGLTIYGWSTMTGLGSADQRIFTIDSNSNADRGVLYFDSALGQMRSFLVANSSSGSLTAGALIPVVGTSFGWSFTLLASPTNTRLVSSYNASNPSAVIRQAAAGFTRVRASGSNSGSLPANVEHQFIRARRYAVSDAELQTLSNLAA